MKLLHYTNALLTALIFLLLGVWGVFFFYAIHYEIMDETDDMLMSYREIFVKKALRDTTLLNDYYDTTFDRYTIRMISDEEAEVYREVFLDDEVYFPEYDEHVPVRVYKSIFLAGDNHFYELEISMSTMERDDMIETLFVFLITLYVLLLVCIIVGNRLILKKSFKPLTRLLAWLDAVVPGAQIPPLDNKTAIWEFRQLNTAAYNMGRRSLEAHEQQKQFIENASHELQTPLAIALNKIELISQEEGIPESQLRELGDIHRVLSRAVRLNKSLLLLSRIENKQFPEEKAIDLGMLVRELSEDLSDVYESKKIDFQIEGKASFIVQMNDTLAQVLILNLLKNAFSHTPAGGCITVVINDSTLMFKNSGDVPLETDKIFNRFFHTSKNQDSVGLGLSVVKSVCLHYHIDLSYSFAGGHVFLLKFPKK